MNLTRYFPKLAAIEPLANQPEPRTKAGKKQRRQQIAAQNAILNDPKKLKAAILSRLNASMDGGAKSVGGGVGGRTEKDGDVDESMTAEQLTQAQERLFREAREQYDQE